MSEAAKDIAAGTIAGMTSRFIGHPFDTVKVRLQDAHCQYSSTFNCVRCMARNEGLRGFYRGVTAPVSGCMLEIGTSFVVYGRLSSLLQSSSGRASSSTEPTPIAHSAAAGFGAGFAVATVITPVELVKCRVQVQDTLPPSQRQYRSVLHCAAKITRSEGLGGLYRGFSSFAARSAPGNAVWYAVYESMLQRLAGPNRKRGDVPLHQVACAGSVAGVCFWSSIFPMDVVKTRIQVDPEYANYTFRQGLREVYRTGGIGALYRGLGVTVIRAIPSNAVLFLTYELCRSEFDRRQVAHTPKTAPTIEIEKPKSKHATPAQHTQNQSPQPLRFADHPFSSPSLLSDAARSRYDLPDYPVIDL